jgi:hypothetical protein
MQDDALLSRIRAEYLEMPGMRLTFEQAQRLCGIEPTVCRWVLETLVAEKFLCVKSDGKYARVTNGEVARRRSAKILLGPEDRETRRRGLLRG